MKTLGIATTIALMSLAPRVAQAQYQQPQYQQPQQYQPQPQYQPTYATPAPREPVETSRPTLGLVIPGAVMLGVSYLAHAALVSPLAGCDPFGSCEGEWDTFRPLGLIPLAGPWIQLAVNPSNDRDAWPFYLVIDGVLQAGGLTMLVLGLALRQTTTSYAEAPDFEIAPVVGSNMNGLTARGRF